MTIFQCEDSPDGILTGIYEAWGSRLGHRNIRLEVGTNTNYELFSEYREVAVSDEKAEKVAGTIKRRLGEEVWFWIYHALLSDDGGKADAVYRTVVLGLFLADRDPANAGKLMENLKEPCIFQVFSFARAVEHEAHRYLGFVRFREMKSGFLFSQIEPSGQILPLVGDHFADRFPRENFVIYDSRHGGFLIHRSEHPWILFVGDAVNKEALKESEQEAEYAGLWKNFVKSIGILERKNDTLRQQLLPIKFRKYMTEFECGTEKL